MNNLSNYHYSGGRALVLLHEKHLRSFVTTWRKAKKNNVVLPKTSDQDYSSMESLLSHVLNSAREYMIWICEKLQLDDPNIDPTPALNEIEERADKYLLHLIEQWRLPLSGVEEKRFHDKVYKSRWGVEYCIEAMLEHAVMHPIRHEFQLKRLMKEMNQSR